MTAEFLWQQRAKPTRGPKPALTLDQIADAAIAIADAEGLTAVSMQRVAADLGYTKMSLYRYLPGKAELVAAMIERAIGEPPTLDEKDGWRAGLTTWAHTLLRRTEGHAWAEGATTGSRPIGPNELGWTEQALRVLPPALNGAERMDTVATVAGHVRMIAGQNVQKAPEESLLRAMAEHADQYPAVAAAMADIAANGGTDEAFSFGLGRILDGLDVLIRSR
ncbi:TetR/AcrR family transcriptional regulator [Actinoplanes sp. NPDC051411]|jgi:AcrR family transcriptional regulator|uniref:TetR/AcrR family transcriptional regulator n=1 Tax=Actinoplanes sp. NPDC051411 TaxID=3155522 RepID=UPI0034159829